MSASSRMMSLKPSLHGKGLSVIPHPRFERQTTQSAPGRPLHARARKVLDLLAHDVDAAVIRGVELRAVFVSEVLLRGEDRAAHLEAVVAHDGRVAVDLARDGEDGRRLARSRGAVEEEVRDAVL